MNPITAVRALHKRTRIMLISTALLVIPVLGQILTQSGSRDPALAFFFVFAGIFIVPTSVILSTAVGWSLRREWQAHKTVMVLCAISIITSLELLWFFVHL